MKTTIYYRSSLMPLEETTAIEHTRMRAVPYLHDICKGELVIGRYSVLPFYQDIEDEITLQGAKLINTYEQHRYVADIANWYEDLKDFTPKTWFRLEDIPLDGPFVLKGRTNSRKNLWDQMMYAPDRETAIIRGIALMDDPLICDQGFCIREYVPLVSFGTSVGGCPISEEYRYFCLNGRVLCGGYYWSTHSEELKEKRIYPDIDKQGPDLGYVYQVLEIIKNKIPFVVIDIARTQDGRWIVIELNDGQMSGLADIDPYILYTNMATALK